MGRILYVARTIGNYGASRMTMHYAIALARAGHEVTIAYGSSADGGEHSPMRRLTSEGIGLVNTPNLQWAFVRGGCRTIDRLAAGADVVISSHLRDIPAAMAAAHRGGARGVAMLQNLPQPAGLGKPIKRWLYRRAINRHADIAVAVGEGVRRHVIDHEGAGPDRVITIPNGIDLEAFPPPVGDERGSVRREFGIADDERIVVNLARINRQKAQDVLINAVAAMDDGRRGRLKILIAGDADAKDEETAREYANLARTRGVADRIIWGGFREDVHRLLYGCDASVLSSRWEGLPIALLESMAAELPFIVTEFGTEVPDVRPGFNGWQVPTEDPASLARALEALMDTPEDALRGIGRRGREIVERHYSLDVGRTRFVRTIEDRL